MQVDPLQWSPGIDETLAHVIGESVFEDPLSTLLDTNLYGVRTTCQRTRSFLGRENRFGYCLNFDFHFVSLVTTLLLNLYLHISVQTDHICPRTI